jgi:CheY-like chemotaxis protein
VGIAQEKQAGIFERFYQPPGSERRSAHLGLPLAKSLIELHGGRLWVESAPGQGSTFSFTLPVQAEGVEAGAGDQAGSSEEKHTVLVVEDDPDIAELIELQLQHEGFDVLVTERGEEAVKLVRTQRVDLVTLDIMLPDIMGTEVLRKLKADPATAHIPVVIVSVLKPEGYSGLDVADHITKPFSLDKLLLTIRQSLPNG